MSVCMRCDWQPDRETPGLPRPREQLVEHATQADHPLCPCCSQSLRADDPRYACETCLTAAREHLSGVFTMWLELDRLLGHVKGQALDSQPGGSGDRQLPGGTVLALLAPGSSGTASRFGDDYEPDPVLNPERWWVLGQHGPLRRAEWLQAERIRYGREHAVDNAPDDAPSVELVLGDWARDWADAGCARPLPARLTVPTAQAYLEVGARWAAGHHDAFPEFASDMQRLHLQLEQVTSRRRVPSKAGVDCFDCGGQLVRLLHEAVVVQWWLPGAVGPLPALMTWRGEVEETLLSAQGEPLPLWTCRDCGQRYDPERYRLALADQLDAASRRMIDGEEFGTPAAVATELRRPERTIRDWARRDLLRQQTLRGVLYVSFDDARTEHAARATRTRSA